MSIARGWIGLCGFMACACAPQAARPNPVSARPVAAPPAHRAPPPALRVAEQPLPRGAASEPRAATSSKGSFPDGPDTPTSDAPPPAEWRWIRWQPGDPAAPRRWGGYAEGSYQLINSDVSREDEYEMLFANRLRMPECRRATDPRHVYAWLYSSTKGSFTAAGRAQRLYRTAYVECPVSDAIRFKHELLIEEQGKVVGRVAVPDKLFVARQFDVDGDGITEAIVEWHRGVTPAIVQGPFGIIGLKDGEYREWYRGRLSPVDECRRKGMKVSQVALGVRRSADGRLEVKEEQWETGCDPQDVDAAIGGWHLTQANTTTLDLR